MSGDSERRTSGAYCIAVLFSWYSPKFLMCLERTKLGAAHTVFLTAAPIFTVIDLEPSAEKGSQIPFKNTYWM